MGNGFKKVLRLLKRWVAASRYKRNPDFSESELKFIKRYLTPQQEALYWQMDPVDQRHTFSVAQLIMKDPRIQTESEREILIEAALLHDIGKVKGDFTVNQRALVKLITIFFPKLKEKMFREKGQQGTLAHAVYVQAVHPERGACMAKTFGTDDQVVNLIKNHHQAPQNRFERCLQDADSLH